MLRLSAAQLLEQKRQCPGQKLIWVDIGGGTGALLPLAMAKITYLTSHPGWNIEQMAQYLPLDTFEAIYLIDLCERVPSDFMSLCLASHRAQTPPRGRPSALRCQRLVQCPRLAARRHRLHHT
jgi:hypothetical protein